MAITWSAGVTRTVNGYSGVWHSGIEVSVVNATTLSVACYLRRASGSGRVWCASGDNGNIYVDGNWVAGVTAGTSSFVVPTSSGDSYGHVGTTNVSVSAGSHTVGVTMATSCSGSYGTLERASVTVSACTPVAPSGLNVASYSTTARSATGTFNVTNAGTSCSSPLQFYGAVRKFGSPTGTDMRVQTINATGSSGTVTVDNTTTDNRGSYPTLAPANRYTLACWAGYGGMTGTGYIDLATIYTQPEITNVAASVVQSWKAQLNFNLAMGDTSQTVWMEYREHGSKDPWEPVGASQAGAATNTLIAELPADPTYSMDWDVRVAARTDGNSTATYSSSFYVEIPPKPVGANPVSIKTESGFVPATTKLKTSGGWIDPTVEKI